MSLRDLSDDRALVAVETPAQADYVRAQSEKLARLFREALGRPVRIEIAATAPESPAARAPTTSESDRAALEHPLVRKAMDLFDAGVLAIEREGSAD